jgi:hypothetical protein
MTNQVIYSIINTMFVVENLTDPILTLALSCNSTSESSGHSGIVEIGAPGLELPSSPIDERVYELFRRSFPLSPMTCDGQGAPTVVAESISRLYTIARHDEGAILYAKRSVQLSKFLNIAGLNRHIQAIPPSNHPINFVQWCICASVLNLGMTRSAGERDRERVLVC